MHTEGQNETNTPELSHMADKEVNETNTPELSHMADKEVSYDLSNNPSCISNVSSCFEAWGSCLATSGSNSTLPVSRIWVAQTQQLISLDRTDSCIVYATAFW